MNYSTYTSCPVLQIQTLLLQIQLFYLDLDPYHVKEVLYLKQSFFLILT
jgi:hypothetical protein